MELSLQKLGAVAVCCSVFSCFPALAQSTGGVVRGNTNINVSASEINTIAVGSGNTAKTSIGTVKGGSRGGNVTVDVKGVSNVVVGRGKKGCVNIGTKGADPDCK